MESARIIARVARMVGDVGTAEELAHDALVAALERWPATGVPDNPGAWLTATAKNRAIDLLRRRERLDRKQREVGRELAVRQDVVDADARDRPEPDEDLGDDLLRLMFIACHPVLSQPARVALTLRLLGGLTTDEIARAFLVPEATVAQRIVRAKRKLRDNHDAYRIPRAAELPDRLHVVLVAISLIFTEGHTATSGDELVRVDLSAEAIRLGRVLVELMPDE
ncbi:MAG TPA: sigma-70 family RNA polymerase sigma factor, partial [Acidimicrobiales bacterium]|nr:sigma-70 family RNA polymerase sigma factor [Acidimicrobiales bacterium]